MNESPEEPIEEGKRDVNRSNLPNPERRALVGKLAKAAVVVPVATFLYDASNNTANGY
jgi:hypothetical protein